MEGWGCGGCRGGDVEGGGVGPGVEAGEVFSFTQGLGTVTGQGSDWDEHSVFRIKTQHPSAPSPPELLLWGQCGGFKVSD